MVNVPAVAVTDRVPSTSDAPTAPANVKSFPAVMDTGLADRNDDAIDPLDGWDLAALGVDVMDQVRCWFLKRNPLPAAAMPGLHNTFFAALLGGIVKHGPFQNPP